MTKAIICGGRDYARTVKEKDWEDVERATRQAARLVSILNAATARLFLDEVIHGGAPGADEAAGQWAASAGIPCQVYPADWSKYGNGAGPIRNQRMLDEESPDFIIAFPGGAGTADMVRRAEKAGVKVHRIDWP